MYQRLDFVIGLHNNKMKYKYLHCNFKLVSWEAVVKVAWLLNNGSENGC